jgi:hypothetical protein
VTDSITGEPLNAKVFISGHDIDSSHVYTDPAVGDYHRLLKGGTYNVTFSAAGYISKTIQVQITDRQKPTWMCNYMMEACTPTLSPTCSLYQPAQLSILQIFRPAILRRKWVFEGGTPEESTEINPTVNMMQPASIL